ncbi:unnamed protein product, partial [Dicrocoelium dendriticum]
MMEHIPTKIVCTPASTIATRRSKRRFVGQKALRIWRLRRLWDKETRKTKSVTAPFVPVQVNNKR